MNKIKILTMIFMIFNLVYADGTMVKLSYENLNFDNSKKKDNGSRYGILFGHENNNSLFQIAFNRTNTDTFKPPLVEDLHVNKYYMKYTYAIDDKQKFLLSYARVDDNLMKETDNGNIYGFGYSYEDFDLVQYFSDYKNFNVYQTEIKYTFKTSLNIFKIKTSLIGKYIHLQDKDSNPFSINAKDNYFTGGLKVHTHYNSYHIGAGAFFGKRVFAVMQDGFRIQHHAMEFNETYMMILGKHFKSADVNLKYVYQNATEIPVKNENVHVRNIIMELAYHF